MKRGDDLSEVNAPPGARGARAPKAVADERISEEAADSVGDSSAHEEARRGGGASGDCAWLKRPGWTRTTDLTLYRVFLLCSVATISFRSGTRTTMLEAWS
jgi:hypothetical protein